MMACVILIRRQDVAKQVSEAFARNEACKTGCRVYRAKNTANKNCFVGFSWFLMHLFKVFMGFNYSKMAN